MNIVDLYHAVTDSRGGVALRLRKSIQTTDGKMLTGAGDPLPPQVRAVKRAPHPMIYRRPTQDTMLTTPTPAENAEWSKRMATMSGYDGGLQWQGDLQPVGRAVNQVLDALRRVTDKARVKDALSQAVCAIANYGNYLETSELESGPSGVLASGSQDELTREDVHAANNITPSKAATGDSGGAQVRGWRDQTANDVASINARNAAFWDKQTAWQKR